MGVLDRGADLKEKVEALLDSEFAGVAVFIDGRPLDVIHEKVGETFRGDASVEEFDDVGVIESGESFALLEKVSDGVRAGGIGRDHLESGLLVELSVHARGLVDAAHPARADEAGDFIRAEQAAYHRCGRRSRHRCHNRKIVPIRLK